MSREEDEHEAVGYKNPPKHSRFKKGQSGNPSGRRKTKPRLDIIELLDKVMAEPIQLTKKDGKVRTVTFLEGLLRKMAASAGNGDTSARRDLLKLMAMAGSRRDDVDEPLTAEEEARILARFIARERRADGGCDD